MFNIYKCYTTLTPRARRLVVNVKVPARMIKRVGVPVSIVFVVRLAHYVYEACGHSYNVHIGVGTLFSEPGGIVTWFNKYFGTTRFTDGRNLDRVQAIVGFIICGGTTGTFGLRVATSFVCGKSVTQGFDTQAIGRYEVMNNLW